MKKYISFSLLLLTIFCLVGPASAATTTSLEKAMTPQRIHVAAIKKANDDYNATMKKANADYKAAVIVAKVALEKIKKEARATMKSAKAEADAALKVLQQSNKSVVLNLGKNVTIENFLVATKNMTVYSKSEDTATSSTCYGTCAVNWPPLIGKGIANKKTAGQIGSIIRTDGSYQVTYNGKPLYFWKGDKKPGDITGNGFGGNWSVVKP